VAGLSAAGTGTSSGLAQTQNRAVFAAGSSGIFALDPSLTEVKNPNAPSLTIDTTGGTADWNHTGQYGGANNGGDWEVKYTFKVPGTLTAGKAASLTIGLQVVSQNPPNQNGYSINALAPGFAQAIQIEYPAQKSASKDFTVPISAGYEDPNFKELTITIGFVSANVVFHYKRAAPTPTTTAGGSACCTKCRNYGVRHVASAGATLAGGIDVHIDPELAARYPHLEQILKQLLRTLRSPQLWGKFWDEKVPLSGCLTTGGRFTFQEISEALQGYLTDGSVTLKYVSGFTKAAALTNSRKEIIIYERAGRDPDHAAKQIYEDYFLARTIFHELMHVFQYDKWNPVARITDYEGFPTATDAKLPTNYFSTQQYPDTGTDPKAPLPAP